MTDEHSHAGFFAALRRHGWTVTPPTPNAAVCPALARRGTLPAELQVFITAFSRCTAADGQTWFLSAEDWCRAEPVETFATDEFELISLQAAAGDASLEAEIRHHWDSVLPLCLNVAGHYQYFAYDLRADSRGDIVQGEEPEFEDVRRAFASLDEFLRAFVAGLDSQTMEGKSS